MAEVTNAMKLIAKIKEAGRKPRSYSGRHMYGRQCVACKVERGEDYAGLPRGYSTDSLGLGTIVYWPGVMWPESMPAPQKAADPFSDPTSLQPTGFSGYKSEPTNRE